MSGPIRPDRPNNTRKPGTDYIVRLVVVLIGPSSVAVWLDEYDFSCRTSIGSGWISVLVIL